MALEAREGESFGKTRAASLSEEASNLDLKPGIVSVQERAYS